MRALVPEYFWWPTVETWYPAWTIPALNIIAMKESHYVLPWTHVSPFIVAPKLRLSSFRKQSIARPTYPSRRKSINHTFCHHLSIYIGLLHCQFTCGTSQYLAQIILNAILQSLQLIKCWPVIWIDSLYYCSVCNKALEKFKECLVTIRQYHAINH